MGYLRTSRNTTKVIPRNFIKCKARPITEVLNSKSWEGKRCFVLCGGPSLRNNFDFSKIQFEKTIGINKAFTKYQTTINYGMDLRFYDSVTFPSRTNSESAILHNAWINFKGLRVFPKIDKARFDPSIYYVDVVKSRCISLSLDRGIYIGNNSGFGGMMLAIALGCKEIYLLGCDMKVDSQQNRTHWHNGYGRGIKEVEKVLDRFKKEFEEIADKIKELDIKVVNLNPDSALNCFPKKDICEII